MQTQHAAVLGHPIGHTMSPFIQKRLFQLSGIPMEYQVLDLPDLAAGLPRLRLVRQSGGGDGCLRAPDMAGVAALLRELPGNVLLTTGSKELHHFAVPGLAERCYPRVLPMVDSLERCLTLGFPPRNIICMQGPFSRELNVALLRQYRIKTLVTKDTGGYGGFREKAEAAREAGCALLVVERPGAEDGLTLEQIQAEIARRTGV